MNNENKDPYKFVPRNLCRKCGKILVGYVENNTHNCINKKDIEAELCELLNDEAISGKLHGKSNKWIPKDKAFKVIREVLSKL